MDEETKRPPTRRVKRKPGEAKSEPAAEESEEIQKPQRGVIDLTADGVYEEIKKRTFQQRMRKALKENLLFKM